MASAQYTLTIPSSTAHLERVRTFIEEHAQQAHFSETTITQLVMAVDEACTNVIEHAYGGEPSHYIDITVVIKPDHFTVRIRDEGEGFDPQAYSEPDLMQFARMRKAGGFGVHIMRRLMDRVEYKKRGKVNECCLIKYREPSTNNEKAVR